MTNCFELQNRRAKWRKRERNLGDAYKSGQFNPSNGINTASASCVAAAAAFNTFIPPFPAQFPETDSHSFYSSNYPATAAAAAYCGNWASKMSNSLNCPPKPMGPTFPWALNHSSHSHLSSSGSSSSLDHTTNPYSVSPSTNYVTPINHISSYSPHNTYMHYRNHSTTQKSKHFITSNGASGPFSPYATSTSNGDGSAAGNGVGSGNGNGNGNGHSGNSLDLADMVLAGCVSALPPM